MSYERLDAAVHGGDLSLAAQAARVADTRAYLDGDRVRTEDPYVVPDVRRGPLAPGVRQSTEQCRNGLQHSEQGTPHRV
jgi:hypothetical protein